MVTKSQHTTQAEGVQEQDTNEGVQEQDTKVETCREEVTGDWEKSQHKKFHNLYSSSNIIWLTKSRRMRLGVGGQQEEQEKRLQDVGGEN